MVSFIGTIILILTCSGISLGQRKSSKNVAVGADVKSSVNFDCPEEFGYYPHPSDCTQYYVCVFGGALLESCTGGLMYSHELQTCDWPRNVGCDGLNDGPATAAATSSPNSASRAPESRSRYSQSHPPPPPPPPKPSAVVTSRGQSRQLHHNQQEIIKQQLYAEAEETLPPAEEVENDRQQRVYRGQPSTVGQVQRDRDGLRHTNAIPSYSGRNEKIGVISFGTQQQQPIQQQYRDLTDFDDILTNDLTQKRSERRKRQVHLRQPGVDVNKPWQNGVPTYKTSYSTVTNPSSSLRPPPPPTAHKSNPRQVMHTSIRENEETYYIPSFPKPTFRPFKSMFTTPEPQPRLKFQRYFNFDDENNDNNNKQSKEEGASSEQKDNYSYFNFGYTTVKPTASIMYTNINLPDIYGHQNNQQHPHVATAHSNQVVYKRYPEYPQHSYHLPQYSNLSAIASESITYPYEQQQQNTDQPDKEKAETNEDDYGKHLKSHIDHVHDEDYNDDHLKEYFDTHSKYGFDKDEAQEEEDDEETAAEKDKENTKENKEPQESHLDYFTPPPSYFKSKTKFPEIRNPFADPNFDFDKFIAKLRGQHEKLVKESAASTKASTAEESVVDTTKYPYSGTDSPITDNLKEEKSHSHDNTLFADLEHLNNPAPLLFPSIEKAKKPKSNRDYYYYYYDDDEDQKPKKYSSQIKSVKEDKEHGTSSLRTPTHDEYYYDYEYPETAKPEVQSKRPIVNKKNQSQRVATNTNDVPVTNTDSSYNFYEPKVYTTTVGDVIIVHSAKINNTNPNDQVVKQSSVDAGVPNSSNYYYYDTLNLNPKLPRNKTKFGEVRYSAKYQEKPVTNEPKVRNQNYKTAGTQQSSTTVKYVKPHTTPLPSFNYNHRVRNPPGKSTTVRSIGGTNRQRLASTTSRNTDYDTKRDHSNVLNRVEESSSAPVQQQSVSTATARTLYNSSRYEPNHYDSYYALYDDDVELYRDVDYHQHYNGNNNNAQQQATPQHTYRGTPSPSIQASSAHEETPKRGSYIQNYNSAQDVYQQSTATNYNDDNNYNSQNDDQIGYRQSARQPPSRGDRNELNYVEDLPTKRITSTTKKPSTTTKIIFTTKSTTTPRPAVPARSPVTANANQTRAQSILNTLPEGPGHIPSTPKPSIDTDPNPHDQNNKIRKDQRHETIATAPITYRPTSRNRDAIPDYSLQTPFRAAVVSQPAPFALPKHHTTTEKTPTYHYITKLPSRSTPQVSINEKPVDVTDDKFKRRDKNDAVSLINLKQTVLPTTYAPPKFFLKSLLPKPTASSTFSQPLQQSNKFVAYQSDITNKPYKTIKTIRKILSPATINNEFSVIKTEGNRDRDSENNIVSSIHFSSVGDQNKPINYRHSTPVRTTLIDKKIKDLVYSDVTIRYVPTKFVSTAPTTTTTTTNKNVRKVASTTTSPSTTTTMTSTTVSTTIPTSNQEYNSKTQLRAETDEQYDRNFYTDPNKKRFRTTIEIPPPQDLIIDPEDLPKQEPDQPPAYKPKSIPRPIITNDELTKTVVDSPRNTSLPTRVSRVNTAIKSLIAIVGTRRQNSKCNDNQTPNVKCNDLKQRTSNTRGRGSAHYSNTGTANGDIAVPVNRGTPAPRLRPTLKPSTSIVSKASEYIDIYRFPPRRPDPIYPQPQPDKTAAKCRKDVCLLPDCSCGGKDIPGELPVEQVPQIVLLTFDDSVNDLNKGLYSDLFEKGRVNPNGCPIAATFYVSHEWTDYSQVQNLYSDGHEIASHTVSHSFGEQFSQKKWTREVAGQREILSAYGGVKLDDVRGMRAPFLSVGGNKMFKMLYDSNFTYDSSMPIYENKPPSWPYTLDYKLFHDCMIPPCPTRSYPGVWEVPMVMWQDLNGGRCSMGDACSNPPDSDGVFKMLMKNFERHYSTNRAPFGLFYHAAWFTQPHHKEGFIKFLDTINSMKDVYLVTNWQAIQWIRDPTPLSRLGSFQPFQCNYSDRPKRCNNPKVCNLWHKSGVRYMRTCQPCPDIYPWTGNTGIRSSRIDNDIED